MSELAEIPPSNKRYNLVLQESEREYASRFFMQNNLDGKKVAGIHMGASARCTSKVWHPARLKEFIKAVHKNGYEVLLFGGIMRLSFRRNL